MAVIVGSARMDERGKATGGKAGDQTGKEVSTQNWYKHKKGWRVLRAKNPLIAQYAAEAMRSACDNDNIGYDQSQNQTLWNAAKSVGHDPAKVTKAVETDCARLVRNCVQYACKKAGLDVAIPDFYTATLVSKLLGTGLFVELKGSKYTDQSTFLGAGDILCTCSKGHVVIVLTNGSKYEGDAVESSMKTYELGERLLKDGCEGQDVKQLQTYLIKLGYDLGSYGADGDFGDATEKAVKLFQKAHGLVADGEYGVKSHEAMLTALEDDTEENVVTITGGSVNIRKGPDKTYGTLKTAHKGDKFERVDASGWMCIKHGDALCWVSDKYVKDGICTASSLNVRKGPGTEFASVGAIKKGNEVVAVDTDGWISILVNGEIYWVSAKYAD